MHVAWIKGLMVWRGSIATISVLGLITLIEGPNLLAILYLFTNLFMLPSG